MPPEWAPGWGLRVEPRALRVPSGAWPWHRPRAEGAGKALLRAWGVHLTWHGPLICRVVGEAIVLHPRHPVSLKIGPQIQIQILLPPPSTPIYPPLPPR